MKWYLIQILVLLILSGCSSARGDEKPNHLVENYSLKEMVDSLGLSKADLSIRIDKSDYRLYILGNDQTIKTYPVVFGGNPIDDKRMQGDQCTPEGVFRVRAYYPHREWSKFIWIDYPNEDSWKKHNLAKQNGEIPEDASIGGEIGIHGVPENRDIAIDLKINWTLGCISLKNKDVDEIYPYVYEGMEVRIQK